MSGSPPRLDGVWSSVCVLNGDVWLIPITGGEEPERQRNAIRRNTNISLCVTSGDEEKKNTGVKEGQH